MARLFGCAFRRWNTALEGGVGDNSFVGAVWVFTRDGNGNWSQQGSKLVGAGGSGNSQQGYSAALSADGNTALVGAPYDSGYQTTGIGAVWIFTRDSNDIWTQQGSKLIGNGAVGTAQQGWSVALSADGNTALEGGPTDNTNNSGGGTGAAWVFTRDREGNWTEQGSKLVGTGAVGTPGQGWSVALSADGTTALEGGPGDNAGTGATWVFSRDINGEWSQPGGKLVGAGSVKGQHGGANQGWSVALSGDGNTVLEGGLEDNPNIDDYGTGAIWVFTLDDGVWSQQGNKLVGAGAVL